MAPDGTPSTLAIALEFIRNEGDAWSWMLDHLNRALDASAPAAPAEEPGADLFADCNAIAAAIGRRLGEMHAVLARNVDDPLFAAEIASAKDAAHWRQRAEARVEQAIEVIGGLETFERAADRERAEMLLRKRDLICGAVRRLSPAGAGTPMIRIHGDFHLGQVLVASGDTYIIDFEGEPTSSIAERRRKASPLRDVSGLLRSIDYAGATLLDRNAIGAVPMDEAQRDHLISDFRLRASTAFLEAYWAAIGTPIGASERALLGLFLIEKAAYEIKYEATNRPNWISVPLAGLARLIARIEQEFGSE